MSAGQDLLVRLVLPDEVTSEATDALDAIVLPFFLLATSGALAGENIAPWTSIIEDKSNPVVNGCSVEWLFSSCNLDQRCLIVFAQMLLVGHEEFTFDEVIFSRSDDPQKMQRLVTDLDLVDPYPGIWGNIEFPFNIDEGISEEISIYVTFSDSPSIEVQEGIEAELSSWSPGFMSSAYGIAPISPDECIGIPDDELIFIDNEMEWHIKRVRAHPSAFKGLVNVFASISHRNLKIDGLLIE